MNYVINPKSKRGTAIVEATLILPVVILAVITIIYIGIAMYEKVDGQCSDHIAQRRNTQGEEVDFARKTDLVQKGAAVIE